MIELKRSYNKLKPVDTLLLVELVKSMKEETYNPKDSYGNIAAIIFLFFSIPAGGSSFSLLNEPYYTYPLFYLMVLASLYLNYNRISNYVNSKTMSYVLSLMPVSMMTTVTISELLILGYITKEEASINLKLFYLFQVMTIIIIRIIKGKGFTIRHF